MRAGLSIGDFSQITHLSVKTLRRYHEAGLLQPAEVDPHTGYRYYMASHRRGGHDDFHRLLALTAS